MKFTLSVAGLFCLFSSVAFALNAPSGLTVKATGPREIVVKWNDDITGETGYILERRGYGKPEYTTVARLPQNAVIFKDTKVNPEVNYDYRVAVMDATGVSPFSAEAGARTPPAAPTAPSNLIVRVVSGKMISVMWTDNSPNEKGFILERKSGPTGTYAKVETISPDETDFRDTTIGGPGAYIYRVRAFNEGGESENSNEYGGMVQKGQKPRISPWILDRGYNKHLNLQITGTSKKWLLTDVSKHKLDPGYEWWYIIGGKTIKTKENLKDEPYNGNQPGRVVKMAGKVGLDTFNRWESDPSKANSYYSPAAGQVLDGNFTGGVVVFIFK